MISAIAPFFVRFNDYRSAPNADTVLIAQSITRKFPKGASLESSRGSTKTTILLSVLSSKMVRQLYGKVSAGLAGWVWLKVCFLGEGYCAQVVITNRE